VGITTGFGASLFPRLLGGVFKKCVENPGELAIEIGSARDFPTKPNFNWSV